MADVWRYRFFQMANGQPGFTTEAHLFDLPLSKVTFNTKLNDVGSWSATVAQSDPAVQRILANQPPWHLLCERTAFYIELNSQIVFGGILTQSTYQRSSHTTQLQGTDWWGYFDQSRLVSWDSSYTNVDELLVAADLFNIALGAASSSASVPVIPAGRAGGNVGVALGPNATAALAGTVTSGQVVTQAYAHTNYQNVGQAIADLSTGDIGFDWTVTCAYDSNGNPTKTWELWYPRAGRTWQSQLAAGAAVLFHAYSADDYTWPTGETQPSNTFSAAGSGNNSTSVDSTASAPDLIAAGWPLLENSGSYTEVATQATLDAIVRAQLNDTKLPIAQPTMTLPIGSAARQPIGSFAIGDDARLLIDADDYFPAGYDSAGGAYGNRYWRVVQIDGTVPDEGRAQMTITFAIPPTIPGS